MLYWPWHKWQTVADMVLQVDSDSALLTIVTSQVFSVCI